MSTINATIITPVPVHDIVDRLRKITIDEQPFIKPKGVLFLGKVNGNTFKLITFNAPPIEVEFTITDSLIALKYQKDSFVPVIKGLTYGLLLPIFIGIFIWTIFDKRISMSSTFVAGGMLILPFLANNIFTYLYNSFVLKKDDDFFSQLEEFLDVKINRS
jgi:hypothetical protein